MKKFLLLIPILVFSCKDPVRLEKPFVIIDKQVDYPKDGTSEFVYQDKNGYTIYFYDRNTKYNVGDTIK